MGNLKPVAKASMDVALSFVAINAPLLRLWLTGVDSKSGLYDAYSNVTLTLGELDVVKGGPSGGACGLVCLAIALAKAKLTCRLLVTGSVDLRGKLGTVGGIMGKTKAGRDVDVERFIIPSENLKQLEDGDYAGWPDDLKAYGKKVLCGATNVVDLFELGLDGE